MNAMELQIAAMAVHFPKDAPLAERVSAAMRYAIEHESEVFWMQGRVNEDMQIRTALAAVLMAGSDEDKEMITRSLAPMKALSALMAGVPVDMSQIDTDNILPLVRMFNDAKDAAKARSA